MKESLLEVGPHLPALARRELEAFVAGTDGIGAPRGPAAPVFVTLRAPGGVLRGCVGSTRPVTPSVAEETCRSARLAGSGDPRFACITAAELPKLAITVSVLLPTEPVFSLDQLEPGRYGIILRERGGHRHALLLPAIQGIEDAATQMALAKQKGGFEPISEVDVCRFEVLKFSENGP